MALFSTGVSILWRGLNTPAKLVLVKTESRDLSYATTENPGFLLPQEWYDAPSRGSSRRGAQWRTVCAAAANQYPRIPLSLLIRSFIGGWVANMAEEKLLRGFTTNMCDTASFTFIGLR